MPAEPGCMDASGPVVESTGRQGPLTRELVIETAIALMDHVGAQQLTMRRLGQALGVEAMALYRHVSGREDLLEGVVARLVDQIRVDPQSGAQPVDSWQAVMQYLAHSVRALALAHPNVFPLMATRHPAAPWLRPPLRSLRVVEEFLQALVDRGMTEERAVWAYRMFTSFLLGHLLLEASNLGAETAPVEQPLDEGDAELPNRDHNLDPQRYPMVQRLQPLLTEDHTEDEFEEALETLLDRLELALAQ